MTTLPTVEDVAAALNKDATDIQATYDAEVADQARRCRVDPYSPALAAALVRRVHRALNMQNIPLGVLQDEAGSTRLGSIDPEIRRLEGPYRKVVIG